MSNKLKSNKTLFGIIFLGILAFVLPVTLLLIRDSQDLRSSAALPDQLETEAGVLSSSGVNTQSDSQASGGQYVRFAKTSSPTPYQTNQCSSGQTFYVSSYGATPNDNISDQSAIVAAINAAKAEGGGRVIFSEGSYRSGYMQISGANNVALCGQGIDKTRIEQISGSNLLQLRNSTRFSIIGITLDGKSLPTTQYLVDIQDSPEFVFDSSAIKNVNDSTLDNIHGLYISVGSPNALIIRSVFDNIRGYGVVRGVSTNNYRDSSDSISGLRVLDSYFSNITSRPDNIGADSDAVVFATRGHTTNGLVENNTFNNIGKRSVKSQANGTVIRCNTMTRSLSAGTAYSAVSIYGNNHLIENNTVISTGVSRYYYVFSVNGSSVVVSNNTVSGDVSSQTGFRMRGGDFTSSGIEGADKKNILVKDNTFLDVEYAVEQASTDPSHENISVIENTTCATKSWWRGEVSPTAYVNSNTAQCGVAPITRNGIFIPFSILQEPNTTCAR